MWRLRHAHIIDVDLRNQPYLFAVITFASSCCHQYRMLHFYVAIYKNKATQFRNTFVLGKRARYSALRNRWFLIHLASTAKVSDFRGLNCAKSRPNFYDAETLLLFGFATCALATLASRMTK